MELPNYFLADLPPEATLTPTMLAEACQALKRNREQYLLNRSTQKLINVIAETAENWRQPDYPFRHLALEKGPTVTGFSRATLAAGLDTFFARLNAEDLHTLLTQELGHPHRLDQMTAAPAEEKLQQSALASGPELLAHIAPGNIPIPALTSLVLGLLVRSAQFVKCATGASFIPRLFAHSLYDADPKLASCLEVAEWKGGRADLEEILFAEADCLTATGSDETLAHIRHRIPHKTRFLGYGHRVSFAYLANDILSGFSGKKIVTRVAQDIAAWDQLGCLSPHVIYVQSGGSILPEQFARMLAQELERLETVQPRGILPVEIAAAIASRRNFYEVRASHIQSTLYWWSKDSTAWSVVFETDPQFQFSCLNRFIYVKGVADINEVLQNAESVRGKVSTVALAAAETQAHDLALLLARWGASRICPVGQMQNPPLTWRHDGRPPLGDLLTWTNWEK